MVNGSTVYQIKRIRSKLSQETAAELLSISTRSLQYIESGAREPKLSLAFKMADIYKCSILEFRPAPPEAEMANDSSI